MLVSKCYIGALLVQHIGAPGRKWPGPAGLEFPSLAVCLAGEYGAGVGVQSLYWAKQRPG